MAAPDQDELIIETWRAARVTRCHTIPCTMPQTLADHTYGMLLLGHLLVPERMSQELVFHILVHDLPEAGTGDIPATAFRIFDEAFLELLNAAEERWFKQHGITLAKVPQIDLDLLFVLDKLEFALFSWHQVRLGNMYFLQPARTAIWLIERPLSSMPHRLVQFARALEAKIND